MIKCMQCTCSGTGINHVTSSLVRAKNKQSTKASQMLWNSYPEGRYYIRNQLQAQHGGQESMAPSSNDNLSLLPRKRERIFFLMKLKRPRNSNKNKRASCITCYMTHVHYMHYAFWRQNLTNDRISHMWDFPLHHIWVVLHFSRNAMNQRITKSSKIRKPIPMSLFFNNQVMLVTGLTELTSCFSKNVPNTCSSAH